MYTQTCTIQHGTCFHRANVFRAIGVIAALEEDLGRAYGFMGFEVPEPAGTRRNLDVPVRWSCRTGVCHTCECGLISGSVMYDPEPLEPPAAGNLLICCSRPQEDVVIDM